MAFKFRYALDGDGILPANDYTLDATYATTAKRGDAVKLNASQNLVLCGPTDAAILGILVGFNFEGITTPTPVVGKVTIAPEAVYQADTTGAVPSGALSVDDTYALAASGNQLDLATRNGAVVADVKQFKVVKIVNGNPYVAVIARDVI